MYRLNKIGSLAPVSAAEVPESRLGIGFEKLDRAVFEPERAYDKLAAIGVKWVRIQSGWQRTERVKGVYSFDWIDSIVDNLIARGMIPWVCLCYGNDLYSEQAQTVFGAVGCPPIYTDEEKKAWHDYCVAFAKHFADRVKYYEIWNEPEGMYSWKPMPDPITLGQFNIDTARAVREGNPDAYLIGGAFCSPWVHYHMKAMKTGMANEIDAISYHEYVYDESNVRQKIRAMRGVCNLTNPKLEIVQGESGAQSRAGGHGALAGGSWTQEKQAKILLRHLVSDLLEDVKFTSYFTTVDMIEALNGVVGNKASYLDYGYFGVLAADFDENGVSTGDYTPKKSYYALQNLASLLGGKLDVLDLPVFIQGDFAPHTGGVRSVTFQQALSGGFCLANGSYAFAYWKPAELMTEEFEGAITMSCAVSGSVHLVDPMDGSVYEIPESIRIDQPGEKYPATFYGGDGILLKHLPCKDYPMFLVFGDIPNFRAE